MLVSYRVPPTGSVQIGIIGTERQGEGAPGPWHGAGLMHCPSSRDSEKLVTAQMTSWEKNAIQLGPLPMEADLSFT